MHPDFNQNTKFYMCSYLIFQKYQEKNWAWLFQLNFWPTEGVNMPSGVHAAKNTEEEVILSLCTDIFLLFCVLTFVSSFCNLKMDLRHVLQGSTFVAVHGVSDYMDTSFRDQCKLPISFRVKFPSQWAASDLNLLTDVFTWSVFILNRLLLWFFASM